MKNLTKRTLIKATTVAFAFAFAMGGQSIAQDKPVFASVVFQGDQFMQSLQQGIREASEAGGAEVLEINVDGDQAREIQAIDTYIARGVDVIIIAPLSATNSAAALQRARDAGIIIIALNGGLGDTSIANATFSTANIDLGRSTGTEAARFIAENMDGKANIAIMAFSSLLPEQSGQRTEGFKEMAAKGNDIALVTEQDAWVPEKAVTVATDIMTAYPEVNLFYAANEGGTVGAMQAVRNAGRAGEVFVFGIDGSEQLAKGLLAGDNVLQAVTAQAPTLMGQQGVEAAFAILDGKTVEKNTTVPALLLARSNKDGIMMFLEK